MVRLPALLLHLTLALPFVRAHSCETDAHEHAEYEPAATEAAAPSSGPELGGGCHSLMRCDAAPQPGLIVVAMPTATLAASSRQPDEPDPDRTESRYSPETPPPRIA